MIYLDNSATTRPCPACVRAMTEALTDCWGNPSSVYALGIDAAHRLRQARQAVAAALGAEPDRVFFTSGGTEADNWAILSAAERLGKRGRHIVTTAVEHHAVLHPMQKLEAKGFEVTYLQPDHDDIADRWRDEWFCFAALANDIESGRYDPAAAIRISDEPTVQKEIA